MLPPEQDVERRRPIWDALQMLLMDTDTALERPHVARVCAESDYTMEELEEIWFAEVFPALRWNLLDVAGEWAGIEIEALTQRILAAHRFGKRRAWLLRAHAQDEWRMLEPLIRALRLTSRPSPSASCP